MESKDNKVGGRLTIKNPFGYSNYKGIDITATTECIDKLGQLEDIEDEFLNYNIDITLFLRQVLNELKQQPTLEIKDFNPKFKILRNDFIKNINAYARRSWKMNRLTLKIDKDLFIYKAIAKNDENIYNYNNSSEIDVVTKLGQLEDIEEELGIDLITLFKACSYNQAYCKWEGKIYRAESIEYMLGETYIYFYFTECDISHLVLELKDYGKTWALTREELE